MDFFELRDRVVGEYASYVKGFFTIRDTTISEPLERELWGYRRKSSGFSWGTSLRIQRGEAA